MRAPWLSTSWDAISLSSCEAKQPLVLGRRASCARRRAVGLGPFGVRARRALLGGDAFVGGCDDADAVLVVALVGLDLPCALGIGVAEGGGDRVDALLVIA
jgi:hypothetical protein